MGWEGLDGRPLLLNGVARRPFVRLSTTMKSPKPGEAGDHKGPPILPSSTLAPTDVDEWGLRLMPLGCPRLSPFASLRVTGPYGLLSIRFITLSLPCSISPNQ